MAVQHTGGFTQPMPAPDAERAALVARWLELTRVALPQAAARHRWPIRLDHCFMRVCLDAAYGRPWHEVAARPAIRYAAGAELRRAVDVAEAILAHPETLAELNAASLRMRGKLTYPRGDR